MRPELARNFLIGLAAIVALFGIGTAGVIGVRQDWVGSVLGRNDTDAPTVMVLSRQLLINGIVINGRESERLDKNFLTIAGMVNKMKVPDPSAKEAAKADAGKAGDTEHRQTMILESVVGGMEDQLSGTIIESLGQSGRFQPIPTGKVSEALADAQNSGKVAPPQGKLVALPTGKQVASTGDAAATSVSVTQPVATGLKQLSSSLHADYTMIVSIGEPRVNVDAIAGSAVAPWRVTMSAQPVISCELFSNKGKEAYRFVKQFDKRISVTVALGDQAPNVGNLRIAFDKINTEISRIASQEILAWSLDKAAPARLMRVDNDLIINRGTNDNVRNGAVYQVERETGEPVMEGSDGQSGAYLGRVRIPVGSIMIRDAQERIATASIASGGPFQKGDIIKIKDGGTASVADSSPETPATGVPLGSQAMSQADASRTSGVALRQASVAVDSITAGGKSNNALAQLVSDAMAQDPRITILPRAQLDKMLRERSLNTAASGDYENAGLRGMATSGYLITGDFTSSSSTSRHANTISVAGITQTLSVSSSTSSSASGTLRAVAVDGRQVQSVKVSAGSINAAVQIAAREMMLKLFPMKIVQVAGTTIAVNRGDDAGIKSGAHLQIYHLGKPIIDKQTGALLSEGFRSLAGEAVVTDVQPNVSSAQLVGSPVVAEGDMVQLTQQRSAAPGGVRPSSAAARPRAPARPKSSQKSHEAGEGLHF